MTKKEVLAALESYGDPQTKKTFLRHGAKEPLFGVKVGDLKKLLKKTKKKNHELSLKLYNTGNSDAMYLAGLIADENKITKSQLNNWVKNAYWYYLSEYAVPWVASETPYGFEIGLEWIENSNPDIQCAGWSTLSNFASIHPDEDLDIEKYSKLLDRISEEIHTGPARVPYCMNAFIIALGSYVEPLSQKARNIAKSVGKVTVDMGDTACKVPLATAYIQKVIDRGTLGKKRKQARC